MILRSPGIDTIVIGGINANLCVDTTAREAAARELIMRAYPVSYDVDAALMSFQLHGCGNHAVPARCWRGERGRSPAAAADVEVGAARGHG